ncbi:MAG: hypothetical protein ACRENE_03320, partial [Polyangiaceae bacterium]
LAGVAHRLVADDVFGPDATATARVPDRRVAIVRSVHAERAGAGSAHVVEREYRQAELASHDGTGRAYLRARAPRGADRLGSVDVANRSMRRSDQTRRCLMRASETARMVGGSIVVYVVMAACSATNAQQFNLGDDGGSSDDGAVAGDSTGVSGHDGSNGGSGSGGGSGGTIFDALTDPVPTAKADGYQSGTRLKLRYYAGADGSKSYSSMHDTQLNLDCYFSAASDGTSRCLPTGSATIALFFGDSGCTQPLAYTPTGCAGGTPTYGGKTGASCPYATTVYSILGAFSGTAYEGSPASCIAASSALLAPYTLYLLGAVVPPSTFVQGTLQTEP